MKVKELIEKLKKLNPDSELFFEENSHYPDGESGRFSLAFNEIYSSENESTILLDEN